MLSVKDQGRLQQIIKYCDRIENKTKDIDIHKFNEDQDLREVICFNIFQIGELAKGFSNDFIKKYNGVPWKQIKGMRDRIGHGYDTIDVEIVFNTSKEDIVLLNNYCKEILDN